MNEKNYVVYCHVFPNKKRYVGITSQKPEYRWNNGKGYRTQRYLYNAIIKYGWHNIEHKILYCNLSKQEASDIEIKLIKEWKLQNKKYGYNIEDGGSTSCVSEETKEKIRKQLIGRKMPTDVKKKISISNTGKKQSSETKKKISLANKGHKHTDITKKILSENHKGEMNPNYNKRGYLNHNSKPVLSFDREGNFVKEYGSIREAAKELKTKHQLIIRVLKGRRKTTSGYSWKYKSEVYR